MASQPPAPAWLDEARRNSTSPQIFNPLQSPVSSPSIATLLNASVMSSSSLEHPIDYFSNDGPPIEESQPSFFPTDSITSPSVTRRHLPLARSDSRKFIDGEEQVSGRPLKRAKLGSFDGTKSNNDEAEHWGEGGEMAPPTHRRVSSNGASGTHSGRNSEEASRKSSRESSYRSQSPLPRSPGPRRPSSIGDDSGGQFSLSTTTEPVEGDGTSPNPYSSNSPLPLRQAPSPPPPLLEPQPVPTRQSVPSSRLEKSMFGVEPIDEFTREVADWIWGFCQQLDMNVVEIEAKIGILINQNTGQRFYSGSPIESIVTDDSGLRFQSTMTEGQHAAYNGILNTLVNQCREPGRIGSSVRYAHSREIDSFHPIPNSGGLKVRVTRDQKDRSLKAVIQKERMADMTIHSPKRLFDFRISVNTEIPAPLPSTEAAHSRFKDRISYTHQIMQVDLTKVGTSMNKSLGDSFELEVEFMDAKMLLREAQKEARGEESLYMDMVQCFLNNIRLLIRNAADP